MRDALFGVSSKRGKYPQLFIQEEDGQQIFVGLWEEIEVNDSLMHSFSFLPSLTFFSSLQSLIECDALPAEVLEANPNIPTFAKVSSS
jgi:hypothetical protein